MWLLKNSHRKNISEKCSYRCKKFPMYKRNGNIKEGLRIEVSKYYLLIIWLKKRVIVTRFAWCFETQAS